MNYLNLFEGNKVYLTSLMKENLKIIQNWYNDSEFSWRFSTHPASPQSEDTLTKWYINKVDSNKGYIFGIKNKNNNDFIGYCELYNIDWVNKVCFISIAIGNQTNRNHGYGNDAMNLLLNFAFLELDMHRVQLLVFSYNSEAISLYEKLGFKKEGCFREALKRNTVRYDIYLYGLLQTEWINI